MEIGKGPYCFKDLDGSSGGGSSGSNTSGTKSGQASHIRAKDISPSTTPVEPKKTVSTDTNSSNQSAKTKKIEDTNLALVKPKESVDADINPIEPNSTEPSADHEKSDTGALESAGSIKNYSDREDVDISSTGGIDKNDENKSTTSVSSIPASNIITDESNKSLSPAKMAKKALSNSLKWGPENFKTTNKNDMLAAYYDNKLTNKKLNFNEVIEERGKNLPMQKDKNGKVIYPSICQYASVAGSINLAGHDYKEGLTKEDVEKILNDAVSGEKCKPYTDVIKEVFGVDAVCHEIPAGLSEKELKALVGDNPAMIRFPQRDFWGNKDLSEYGRHGIGYSNGGFIEPYMGRNGESWKDVRGARSTADFTSNLGGFYFEIKK